MTAYRGDPFTFHFFARLQDFFKNRGLKINLCIRIMAFCLYSALCTGKTQPNFWDNSNFRADVKGGTGSYPGWHHVLCGHTGTWLFMNYFPDMLDLCTENQTHRNTEKLNRCFSIETHKYVLVWNFRWDISGSWFSWTIKLCLFQNSLASAVWI